MNISASFWGVGVPCLLAVSASLPLALASAGGETKVPEPSKAIAETPCFYIDQDGVLVDCSLMKQRQGAEGEKVRT